jgi:hypothetical protein
VLLLKQLRQEAVDGLRNFNLKQSGEDCKARVGVLRTQYNLAYLFENLPQAIKDQEKIVDQNEKKVQAFKSSQEGGTL